MPDNKPVIHPARIGKFGYGNNGIRGFISF
jgi:hypothetical protein